MNLSQKERFIMWKKVQGHVLESGVWQPVTIEIAKCDFVAEIWAARGQEAVVRLADQCRLKAVVGEVGVSRLRLRVSRVNEKPVSPPKAASCRLDQILSVVFADSGEDDAQETSEFVRQLANAGDVTLVD